MTEFETNVLNRIGQLVQEGKLSNDFLVENFKLSGNFLNIKTKSNYKREAGISYPGVKPTKTRRIEDMFGVKFVIDNH